MKRKISVINALIKTRNIMISNLEKKLEVPKGYISKVIDGKQSMKPVIFIKLLEELDITLDQYEELNQKAKALFTDSTLSNEKRWQHLLLEIYTKYPSKNNEEQKIHR